VTREAEPKGSGRTSTGRTDDSGSALPKGEESKGPRWSDRVHHSGRFNVAVGVATIIGGLVAGLTWLPHLWSTSDNSTPSTIVPAASAARSSPSRAAYAVGQCLSKDLTAVPCGAVHGYEVISSTATCAMSDLISYLGGRPARDVLGVAPSTVRPGSGAQSVCVVAGPAGVTLLASVRGVLQIPAGGAWRRCWDDATGRDLPCDRQHSDEYVGVPAGTAPDQAECIAAAEQYMGLAYSQVSDQLDVVALATSNTHDGRPRCLIRVRGDNVLTDSLYAIGMNALPLQARS
jgi:hypothetical protein